MQPVKIALLQCNFRSAFDETIPSIARVAGPRSAMTPDDLRFNHELLISQAREAAAMGAKLLVTPESYLDGWSFDASIMERTAMTIPGPRIDELVRLSAELVVWMLVAVMVKTDRGLYNACVVIDDRGQIRTIYYKTHETKAVLKRMPYVLGEELPVFETPWGRAGVLICHDRWYPEAVRTLRRRGAEMIFNPTAAAAFSPDHPYSDIHQSVLRSHAYLNGIFFASCNGANHGGHSLVIAPDGQVIARGLAEQQIVLADLDPAAHGSYDFVSNLREGLYQIQLSS